MCCSVTAGELTDEYRVGFRQKVRHQHAALIKTKIRDRAAKSMDEG